MKFLPFMLITAMIAALPAFVAAQNNTEPQSSPPPASGQAEMSTKVGIVDIDRVVAESNAGKALFEKLQQDGEKLNAGRVQREQELAGLQNQMTSGLVSSQARERLTRELERKRTDAQRWLEDANRVFQETQQAADLEFQDRLRPIIDEVAGQLGFGLVFRTNRSLTMVLNPALDITPQVIEAFNKGEAVPPGEEE
jgi:Skp family chaperone for outer membrane proteins